MFHLKHCSLNTDGGACGTEGCYVFLLQRLSYFMDSSNPSDWATAVSSLAFVVPMFFNVENKWHWEAGALAILFAWINFLLYFQRCFITQILQRIPLAKHELRPQMCPSAVTLHSRAHFCGQLDSQPPIHWYLSYKFIFISQVLKRHNHLLILITLM